jgi:hypothetical protein
VRLMSSAIAQFFIAPAACTRGPFSEPIQRNFGPVRCVAVDRNSNVLDSCELRYRSRSPLRGAYGPRSPTSLDVICTSGCALRHKAPRTNATTMHRPYPRASQHGSERYREKPTYFAWSSETLVDRKRAQRLRFELLCYQWRGTDESKAAVLSPPPWFGILSRLCHPSHRSQQYKRATHRKLLTGDVYRCLSLCLRGRQTSRRSTLGPIRQEILSFLIGGSWSTVR